MSDIGTLVDFTDGQVLYAAQLDSNFSAIRTAFNTYAVQTDKASQVITKTVTFTPDSGAGFIVSQGGYTVTGNSTLTGSLGGIAGLTVASVGITVTAGDLLLSSGNATLTSGNLTLTAGNLTLTLGNATLTAGNLTLMDGNLRLVAGQAAITRYDAGNTSTAKTIDWDNGNMQKVVMTGNCTFTFSNPVVGSSYMLECLQDGSGGKTATWPSTVKWEGGSNPTLTTTASRKDVFVFTWNGTNYLGVIFGLNFNETT